MSCEFCGDKLAKRMCDAVEPVVEHDAGNKKKMRFNITVKSDFMW